MTIRIATLLLAVTVFLVGCASPPQHPVAVRTDSLKPASKIGVAMTPLPKVDTEFPGAGCLLCLAAASVANRSLTDHVVTLSSGELQQLKGDVADLLRGKGYAVVEIAEPVDLKTLPEVGTIKPNFARRDFASLKGKYGVDKLLVIDVTALGVWRTYSSYIPTSDPKAVVQGSGYIVDLATNAYDWYLPLSIQKASDQKWDEPPKFPGLTNAYFQAIEAGKDTLTKPFSE